MKSKINEKIDKILGNHGLKITLNRRAILKLLFEEKKPVSFEQIKNKLKLDKATFYRNMSIFEQKNIINRFESKDRVWHYELGGDKHAHFICEECKKILCFKTKIPPNIEGCEIKSMTLKGICEECQS